MRFVAIATLCLLLCGCFSSNGPVFDATRGACPFAQPTAYRELERGQSAPAADAGNFVFENDGQYCKTTDADGKISRTLFVPMGRDWWIVQDDADRPSYLLMHRSGDRLIEYMPRCQDFSASRLRRLGVQFDDERNYCTVTEARQIEELFRSWRSPFRQPMGAFRRAAN